MAKKFGDKRVPTCYCTENFTCGPCLAAVVYHYTPTSAKGSST